MTPQNWTLFWGKMLTLKWQAQQTSNAELLETLYEQELRDIPDALVPAVRSQLGLLANGWLPSADEVLRCAREMQRGSALNPSDVVSEVMGQIKAVGWCGTPKLSPIARKVVDAYGGWTKLCSEPIEHGVLVGMLRKFAADAIEAQERQDAIAPLRVPISANGNGRKALEAKS